MLLFSSHFAADLQNLKGLKLTLEKQAA